MSSKKRKRSFASKPQIKKSVPKAFEQDDLDNDEVGFATTLSDDDNPQSEDNSEQEVQETPDEKRLRLAKEYLQQIQEDESTPDTELIASRLKNEAMEARGRMHRQLADQLSDKQLDMSDVITLKGHQRAVTCVAVSHDDRSVFSVGKDCMIYKWDAETGKKIWQFHDKGYKQILCVTVSSDGKYLAYAGIHPKHEITIHDPENNKRIDAFKGHRDTVSVRQTFLLLTFKCLAFRIGTSQLFSGSFDRTIKIWNTEAMSYVDTLYGHQSEITALDCAAKERAVSCGHDKSLRIWKVIEETQLVFRGQQGNTDCVALISDDKFISGSDDGTIALWLTQKKKPVCIVKAPHDGKWITSVAAFKQSDLVACGSHNGIISLWRADPQSSQLLQIFQLLSDGFVNSLQFSRNGKYLVAGLGREHRLGRWDVLKGAKNCVKIIPLNLELNKNNKTTKT